MTPSPTETDPPPLPPPLPMPSMGNDNVEGAVDNAGSAPVVSVAVAAAAAASTPPSGESPNKKPTAKKKKASSSSSLKRVTKTSFAFKSDIVSSDEREAHASGILHATKSSATREEHTFAWLSNVNDARATKLMIEYLSKHGFKQGGMKFIPFSSKEGWSTRYPHAIPHVEANEDGKIAESAAGTNAASSSSSEALKSGGSKKKKGKARKSPPKLVSNGHLHNDERDELHREIYRYFSWLHSELEVMETTHQGRRAVSTAGVNVPALRGVVGKLESSFRMIREVENRGRQGSSAASASAAAANGTFDVNNPPGAEEEKVETVQEEQQTLPFLESALELEWQRRVQGNQLDVDAGGQRKRKASAGVAEWRSWDFDTLFSKLVEYKTEKGDAKPALTHPELGRWVMEVRANKKALREKGLEWEVEGAGGEVGEANASGEDGEPMKKKAKGPRRGKESNTHLSPDRVERLESLGFVWAILPTRVSWEDRLEELKQFKEQHGKWPTNKQGTIGNWLKNQRRLYSKNDSDFMAKRFPLMEAIGVPLRTHSFTPMTWDDRFQQLVEFGRVHRHFNVPKPSDDVHDPSSAAADNNRFYKFVNKLHSDYRLVQRGDASTSLTEERIQQLRNIGFQFNTNAGTARPVKIVPEVDWNTRIQHLESFQSEMGHMRVDPNYDKYSNLGGWAVEVSKRHRSWQEGHEYLDADTVEKFNQLSSIGFGFDVFKSRRGERTWEQSFNLLMAYRAETGSTRVPHHYKADFRLGSWVAVQRKEYKALQQGKPSKMTEERIIQLESIGFEWVARRGQDD